MGEYKDLGDKKPRRIFLTSVWKGRFPMAQRYSVVTAGEDSRGAKVSPGVCGAHFVVYIAALLALTLFQSHVVHLPY